MGNFGLSVDQQIPYKPEKPIYVPDGDGLKSLYTHEIFYIKSDGNYCRIYAVKKGKFFQVRSTMKDILTLVGSENFSKIHNQYFVSLYQIDRIDKFFSSVLMKNGDELPISRARQEDFKKDIKRLP